MADFQRKTSPSTAKRQNPSIPFVILGGLKFFLLFVFRMVVIFGCIGIIIGSVFAVAISLYVVGETANDDKILDLGSLKLSFTTIIYTKNTATGEYEEYHRLVGEENRIWVDINSISKNMQNAIVAVEDDTFYEHTGVNYKRTVAAFVNAYTPVQLFSTKQGASTITQQLIKNITFDDETDAQRKIREIFRAMALENRYTKEVILEAYLNTFRLSGNIAGVQTASNTYFGKNANTLEVWEAAMIAGITRSPVEYDPYKNSEKCLARRNDVLYYMNLRGYLNDSDYEYALQQPLGLISETQPNPDEIVIEDDGGEIVETTEDGDGDSSTTTKRKINSYFVDMVIDDVIDELIKQKDMSRSAASDYIYNGGLRIYSTMVPELQSAMEDVMQKREMFPEMKDVARDIYGNPILNELGETTEVFPQAGMVSVNYKGEICAVVGGIGEKTEDRGLNRAVDSVRHTGSTMKPIGSYALGLEYNYIKYSTKLSDSPVKKIVDSKSGMVKDWPRNYSGGYQHSPMSVADAIAKSINTVAVRVLQYVTPKASFDFLTNTLKISSLVEEDLDLGPLALGSMTYGISPLEMAGAYMIFGNGGKFTTLHSFTGIENASGDLILEPEITTIQAISPETSMIMNKLLENVLFARNGTGYGLAPERIPAVGKTGTSSEDRDHWFIGLTPYYCTATWWGYENPQTLNWRTYSKHPPTMAWRTVMNDAQADFEYKAFPVSEKVVQLTYCQNNGLLAVGGCPPGTGYYKRDFVPAHCPGHGGEPVAPVE